MAGAIDWDALGTPVEPRRRQQPEAVDWDALGSPVDVPQPAARLAAPKLTGPVQIPAGTVPHDGDTFPLGRGQNGRLYGADAFELGQPGYMPGGVVDLGAQGQAAMQARLARGGTASPTGASTYGRPVVSLNAGGGDAAEALIRQGQALPVPQYLATDPARRDAYISAQRDAIAAERGAYAGQYQAPADYRKGGAGPMHGKIAMTPEQSAAYEKLVRNPDTTPEALSAWATSQGQAITNAGNILQFMRRNPAAQQPRYFQQQDVTNAAVLPNGPGAVTRTMGSFNEGLADTLGAPVDLAAAGLRAVGLPVGDAPFGGSASISSGLHALGIGQVDQGYSPRSDVERYAQSIARGVGQAALPVVGTIGAGGALARTGGMMMRGRGAISQALRTTAIEAAQNPGLAIAGEVGGAVGGGIGGQAARDAFPGNPYADMAGQIIGGGAGGFAGALTARRPIPISQRVANAAEAGTDSAGGQAQDQARGLVNAVPTPPPVGDTAPSGIFGRGPQMSEPMPPIMRGGIPPLGDQPFALGEGAAPSPSRTRDRIDVGSSARAAQSDSVDWDSLGTPVDATDSAGWDALGTPLEAQRPTRMDQRVPPEQMAALARSVEPGDMLPRPSNEVGSAEEAAAIGAGLYPQAQAPNPRDALPPYTLPGQTRPRRNPLDLAAWLRTQGGVQDQGGELSAMGITNARRDLPLAGDVGLPRLVNPQGLPLDEAADAAWRAGYFPNSSERPTIGEFLETLGETHRGGPGRAFHPDDYEAVANFNSADADRQMIEAAASRGEPLHENAGQPVSLPDLEANAAPVSAYEDLPKVWGRVGNIDLSRLETSQDIGRAIYGVQAKTGGFDAARRGRMGQEETRALAQEMGMTADDLLRRRKGQALNAEQAIAARSIFAKSGDELVKLATKAKGGSDADLAVFRQAWVRHAAIQEQIAGATAEAGRALASFKMTASSRGVAGNIHKLLLDEAGGRDRLEEVAKRIADLAGETNDPATVARFARDALKPKMADKLTELYINSLLSGPQTHAANFLSNSLTAALQIPEHLAASAIGAFRPQSADRVLAGELPARVFGMLQGVREGLQVAGSVMMTGRVPDHVAKVEAAEQHAISGVKGSIIRTPTRALSAADEVFKGAARRMEINGLALRKAAGEGLTGADLRARVADLSANPTDEMVEQAKDYARYVTFQRPLGDIGRKVTGFSSVKAGPVPIGKLIIPFVRTPANLMKFAVERSPAAPLLQEWRADFAAGGARRDLAAARAVMGSGLGMLIAQYAMDGKISGGGPADEGATALMRADGWQPYSIRIGDQWVSYSRFDPLALTIGTAADIATKGDKMTDAQREEAAGVVTASIVRTLADKTWLSGISELVNFIDNPFHNGGTYLRNQAASVTVPALLAQMARASDPYMRDTKTVGDAIKARIPVLSQGVPSKLDAWGMPVERGNLPYGLSTLTPINVSTARNNPVNAALLAAGAHISRPSQSVGGVKLTPEQYRSYQVEAGQRGYPNIMSLTQSLAWAGMSNGDRQDAVSDLMRRARTDARAALGFNWRKEPRMFGGGVRR